MSRGALRDVCYGKNPPFSKHSRALLSMRTSFQTYYAQPPNIEGGNHEETNFRIICESAKKRDYKHYKNKHQFLKQCNSTKSN